MQQGSLWNRNTAVAVVLSAAVIVGLGYLLSRMTTEESAGPRGAGGSGAIDPEEPPVASDPRGVLGPGGDAESPEHGDTARETPAGPPLLRGVVSGEGAPIAGASVRLVPVSYVDRLLSRIVETEAGSRGGIPDFASVLKVVSDGIDAARRSAHVATTDESGVYEFRGIEAADYLALTVADGWVFRYGDVVVLAAEESRELNQELQRGATISGRAVGARGEGVDGARVTARIRAPGGSVLGLVFARLVEYADGTVLRGPFAATTAGDGAFTIASLPPGSYDLEARGPSGLRVEVQNVATGSADVLVYLGAPAWVEGVVVDPEGAPLEGIALEVDHDDGAPMNPMMAMSIGALADAVDRGLGRGPRAVETDAFGKFRVGPFAPGAYRLAVVDPDVRPLQRRFTLSSNEELPLGSVQVDPGDRVEGRVLAEDGAGIEGATVIATPADPGLLGMDSALQDFLSRRNQVESKREGAFEVRGLAPGRYWLSASVPGWSPAGVKVEAGEDDCEIRLARGERVTGRVTDARSGDSVRAGVKAGQVATETDAEGRFTLDGVARIDPNDPAVNPMLRLGPRGLVGLRTPEQTTVTLTVTAEGYATSVVTLNPGENEADVRLRPAPEIHGRVLSPAGEPVAGSLVRVVSSQQGMPANFIDPSLLTLRSAVSDAEGRYRIQRFRDSGASLWYRVLADHPESARGASESFRLEADESYEIDLTLKEPATVQGIVTDGTRPLAGAEVRLAEIDKTGREAENELMMRMFGFPRGGAATYSDAEGRFAYRRVVPGDYAINANVPGLGSAPELEIRVEAGTDVRLELFVDAGEEIRGMVLDTEGNSLEGAAVKLLREPEAGEGRDADELRAIRRLWGAAFRTARTDEEGVFAFSGIPEGRYVVQAHAPGFVGGEVTDVAPGATDVELILAMGAGLEGRVLDAATGDAVSDFSFFVVPANPGADQLAFQALSERGEGGEGNHPEGRFSRSDLAPGAYRVSVRATGYLPNAVEVELIAGRVIQGDVRLVRGARIRGSVVDQATRRPVAGAHVRAMPARRDARPGPGEGVDDETVEMWETVEMRETELWESETTLTDAGGRFVIDGVPSGVVTVLVQHNEYVPATEELSTAARQDGWLEIELTRGLTLGGRLVTESGEGVGSRFLALTGDSSETRGVSKSAVTAPDGAFRFRGLKPGKYRIHVPSVAPREQAPFQSDIDLPESVMDHVVRLSDL